MAVEPFATGSGASILDGQLSDPLLTTLVLRDSPPPGDFTFGEWLWETFPVGSRHFRYPVLGSEEAFFQDGEGLWPDATPIPMFKPSWSKQLDELNRYALGSAADVEAQLVAEPGIDVLARNGVIARIRTVKAAEYTERASKLANLSVGVNVGAIHDKTGLEWDLSGDMFDDIKVEVRRIIRRCGCSPKALKLALFNRAYFAATSDPILKLRRSYTKGADDVQLPEISAYLGIGEVRDCHTLRGIDSTGAAVDMWPDNTAILFYPGNRALMQLGGLGDRFWGATFRLGIGGALPPQMLDRWAGLGVAWRTWEKTRLLDPDCSAAFINVWSKS